MSKTLYLECTFGISGDMFVGSLLDLGADEKKLEQALASLPVKGFHTCISRVKNQGWMFVIAVLLDEHENHDHDMSICMEHIPRNTGTRQKNRRRKQDTHINMSIEI